MTSDNALLKMQADADMRLDRKYLDGKVAMNVENVGLHELGISPKPLKHPFAFTLGAEARHDSIKMSMDAGDLDFQFRARSTLQKLMDQGTAFATLLTRQIELKQLDHAELRKALPSAGMQLKAGKQNPVSYFLATKDISLYCVSAPHPDVVSTDELLYMGCVWTPYNWIPFSLLSVRTLHV